MTVCIAAIALVDPTKPAYGIVAAADHMMSVETSPGVIEGFEKPQPKCYQFGDTTVALFAGVEGNAREVRRAAKVALGTKQRHDVRDVAEALGTVSVQFFRARFQREYLDPLDTTIGSIHGRKKSPLAADVVYELREKFTEATTECEWIVAGVDADGAQLFYVSDRGVVEARTGEASLVIGTGADIASYMLRRVPHHHTRWFSQALFDVYAAKRSAEAIHGVGKELTTLVAVDSTGCRYTAKPSAIGQKLEGVWDEIETQRRSPNVARAELLQNVGKAFLAQKAIP